LHKDDNIYNNSNKPESVLELANMFIYWDKSIVTDRTVDFNRPDTALIGRENETLLVTNKKSNLPRTGTEKLRSIKT